MNSKFDRIDDILYEHVKNMDSKKYSQEEKRDIIIRAKEKQENLKIAYLKMLKTAACFVIIVLLGIGVISEFNNIDDIYINSNSSSKYNNFNIDGVEINMEKKSAIIKENADIDIACYIEPTEKELYNNSFIIIGTVQSGLSYTDYDRLYDGGKLNGQYGKTSLTTIGNIRVEKIIKNTIENSYTSSNFYINEGDVIEFRRFGGVVTYDKMLDYFDGDINKLDPSIELKYNGLKEKGIDNIYVSYNFPNNVALEEGKTYLLYVVPKAWGDYWISDGIQAVREYDLISNKIFNNITKEYEDINSIEQ